ncbi:hypothetical protein [Pseudokineococcus sp. 1T1Z-3]|uniref:hypothetical protein n=1 Tax=Pseudokineococcus sp. 1T1Z-3 TaxID=3132745 RepID=UPI0030AC1479
MSQPSQVTAWLHGQAGERRVEMSGWVGQHPGDGGDQAHLVLAPTGHGGAAGMRQVAEALGLQQITGPPAPVPASLVHVLVEDDELALVLSEDQQLRRPLTEPEWTAAATARGTCVLTAGTDPLLGGPTGDDFDAWIRRTQRLRWGVLDVRTA